jgi:hypothetical protein
MDGLPGMFSDAQATRGQPALKRRAAPYAGLWWIALWQNDADLPGHHQRAIKAPESRHAMFRLRANAARASLWLDTIPKAARLFFPKFHLQSHRQDGYIEVVETGSQIWIAGTDEKERIEKILGQELVGWNILLA